MSFKKARKPEELIEKKSKTTKKVDENLGKKSNFKTVTTRFKEKNSRVVNSKKKRLVNKSRLLKPKKKLFSLEDTVVSKRLQNNPKVIKKLPISLKSVMLSKSSNVKNDFLKKEDKKMESSKTSNAFRVCFQTPVKLEIVGDYTRDKKGNKYLSKSNWKTLNEEVLATLTKPTICRMSYHHIQNLTDPLEEFHIANKYFILTPRDQDLTKAVDTADNPSSTSVVDTIQSVGDFKSEYATSNVILQFQGNINTRQINTRQGLASPQSTAPAVPTAPSAPMTSTMISTPTSTGGGY